MKFFGKCAVVLAVMLALPMTLTAQIKVTHGACRDAVVLPKTILKA